MKLKKTLACVAAGSVAVSALAVSAFAAVPITDGVALDGVTSVSEDGATFTLDLTAPGALDGVDIANVYGASIKLAQETVDASAETGIGGGIIYNRTGGVWDSVEWGNAAAGKPISMTADGTITRLGDAPAFTAEDVSGADETWGQVCLQVYWGPEAVTVESVSLLGADGAALKTFSAQADNSGEEVTPGVTDFSGGTPTNVIPFENPGALANVDGQWKVVIVDSENNLLGDRLSDLNNAMAIGVRFEVSEYDDYAAPFDVSIEVGAGDAQAAVAPVTVEDDGQYIAWATFDKPVVIDDSFSLDLATTIAAEAAPGDSVNAIAAGDGLPAISLLELGVQDGKAADDNTNSNNNPSDTPNTDDNTNNGGNNNVNTGVTLAVVPAAIAAAALAAAAVAAKKRK